MRNLRVVRRDLAPASENKRPEPDPCGDDSSFDPVVRALLEHARFVPPLRQVVRTRALARARAAIHWRV